MHGEMAALTLRIAGQALLGADLATQSPQVRAALNAALADFAATGGFPGTSDVSARPCPSPTRRSGRHGADVASPAGR